MNLPSAPPARAPGTLFLSSYFPSSEGKNGTEIRAAALIRMLAARGPVHLLVIQPVPIPGSNEATKFLRLTADEVQSECLLADLPAFISAHARQCGLERVFVFRMETALYIWNCLDFFSPRLLDLDELPSRRLQRIMDLKTARMAHLDKKAIFMSRAFENNLLPRFDHVFVSSEAEAQAVRGQTSVARLTVLPNIRPRHAVAAPPSENPREFLFVGLLSYPPNEDAVLWFAREILPLLRDRSGPEIIFRVVGGKAKTELDVLRDEPGVCLAGYQEDLAPFYARATAAVVPLRAGAGTRLKILEAFAYERPVVSTSIGAEGLEVIGGRHLLLADTPAAFAEACQALIDQPSRARSLVQEAARLQRERYSDEALLRCYDESMAERTSASF